MNTLRALFFTNYPTFRQWVQVVGAAVLTALVSHQFITNDVANAVLVFIAALLPPALSVFNSADGVRTFLYGAILAVQALVLVLNVTDAATVDSIVNIALAAIGAGVAVTHTPTPLAAAPLKANGSA